LSERFLGEDGRGEGHFSVDEWITFQRRLVTADAVVHQLAAPMKAEVMGNLRGEWPARGLRIRKGFRIGEIRITLNPKYLDDKGEHYELRSLILFEPLPVLWTKLEETEVSRTFQPEEMDDRQAIATAFESELRRMIDVLSR